MGFISGCQLDTNHTVFVFTCSPVMRRQQLMSTDLASLQLWRSYSAEEPITPLNSYLLIHIEYQLQSLLLLTTNYYSLPSLSWKRKNCRKLNIQRAPWYKTHQNYVQVKLTSSVTSISLEITGYCNWYITLGLTTYSISRSVWPADLRKLIFLNTDLNLLKLIKDGISWKRSEIQSRQDWSMSEPVTKSIFWLHSLI